MSTLSYDSMPTPIHFYPQLVLTIALQRKPDNQQAYRRVTDAKVGFCPDSTINPPQPIIPGQTYACYILEEHANVWKGSIAGLVVPV
jgi:hypothetical protein